MLVLCYQPSITTVSLLCQLLQREPNGPWSIVVHRIGHRVPFGTQPHCESSLASLGSLYSPEVSRGISPGNVHAPTTLPLLNTINVDKLVTWNVSAVMVWLAKGPDCLYQNLFTRLGSVHWVTGGNDVGWSSCAGDRRRKVQAENTNPPISPRQRSVVFQEQHCQAPIIRSQWSTPPLPPHLSLRCPSIPVSTDLKHIGTNTHSAADWPGSNHSPALCPPLYLPNVITNIHEDGNRIDRAVKESLDHIRDPGRKWHSALIAVKYEGKGIHNTWLSLWECVYIYVWMRLHRWACHCVCSVGVWEWVCGCEAAVALGGWEPIRQTLSQPRGIPSITILAVCHPPTLPVGQEQRSPFYTVTFKAHIRKSSPISLRGNAVACKVAFDK